MSGQTTRRVAVALAVLFLVVRPAAAQTNSAIAGQARDNTGGVLPGVTIEARSPALIEGTRVVVTDAQGRYTMVDLRPGTYTVTFMLPGFKTVIREDVVLPGNFTMTLNVELEVGGIQESITVSGETPVVDVQQTRRAEVLDREMLDAVPTGRNIQSTGQLVPGVKLNRPEVGLTTATQQTYMFAHGMGPSQNTVQVDGMMVNGIEGDGSIQNYFNHFMSEQMVYETAAISAETSGGGVRLNMIPREGGNTFSGQAFFGISDSELQGDNLEAEDEALGLRSSESIDQIYDLNLAQGGRIIPNKLWFFGSFRRWVVDKPVTDSFARNAEGTVPARFDPNPQKDLSLVGIDDNTIKSGMLRLTYQMSQKNKLSAYLDRIIKDRFHEHGSTEDVATASTFWKSPIYYTGSVKYTSAVSNKMLVEAGYSSNIENWTAEYQTAEPPFGPASPIRQARPANLRPCFVTPCFDPDPNQFGATLDPWYAVTSRRDLITGFRDRANNFELFSYPERFAASGAVSYVTGSHNIKVGVQDTWGPFTRTWQANGDISEQLYVNGRPDRVVVTNWPIQRRPYLEYDLGVYAQDSWTMNRLTLNGGVRFEWMKGRNDENTRVMSRFVPSVTFAEQEDIPDWFDVSPRVGASYDLFGDAKTALKFTFGRHMIANTSGLQELFSPANSQTDVRSWFDCHLDPANPTRCSGADPFGTNGDDFVQDWEIGPPNTQNFGLSPSLPRLESGQDVGRPYTLNWSAAVNHEIRPGMSVNFAWYRRSFHDTLVRDNLLITPADFTRFEIANPCFGGNRASNGFPCATRDVTIQPTLPVYNLNPEKQGLIDEVILNVPDGSDIYQEVYDAFEVSWSGRLRGAQVFGGWTIERNEAVTCHDPDDPNRLLFCDGRESDIPWQNELKLAGSVPLLYGIQVSGSWLSFHGQEIDFAGNSFGGAQGGNAASGAQFGGVRTNGDVAFQVPVSAFRAAGLTRTRPVTIPLLEHGSSFFDRQNQVDIRIGKWFDLGRGLGEGMRLQVQADIFNILNTGPAVDGIVTFGGSLGRPTETLQPRFLQLSTMLTW